MQQKLHVGILFGGKSTEHEISILSARSVFEAVNRQKYDVSLIGIDKLGHWSYIEDQSLAISNDNQNPLALIPGTMQDAINLVELHNSPLQKRSHIDVIFPVLHGIYGEDGSIQGMLKVANIPYVGADVIGSAVGMDKDIMKRLLRDANINVSKFLIFHEYEKHDIDFEDVCAQIGLPFFMKPANTGSSVGVYKIKTQSDFQGALDKVFMYDRKIILEEFIEGREIECAVLGNEAPIASIAGEIIPHHEFYSYEAKYLDEQGATLKVPAEIDEQTTQRIQDLAIKTFRALCCSGMARVDFFLRKDGEIFVNEINTIPGFTSISMYPRLWQASGISYPDLIDKLITLALDNFEKQNRLCTQFKG